MHIDNPLLVFSQVRISAYDHNPVSLSGKCVLGKFAQIPSLDQVIERFRQRAPIGSILVYQRAYFIQVISKESLTLKQQIALMRLNGTT